MRETRDWDSSSRAGLVPPNTSLALRGKSLANAILCCYKEREEGKVEGSKMGEGRKAAPSQC